MYQGGTWRCFIIRRSVKVFVSAGLSLPLKAGALHIYRSAEAFTDKTKVCWLLMYYIL